MGKGKKKRNQAGYLGRKQQGLKGGNKSPAKPGYPMMKGGRT